MEPAVFQTYKLTGVVGAFLLSGLLQTLAPYRGSWPEILHNWKTNLSLGLVGSIVMGMVCGGCVCALSTRMAVAGSGLFRQLGLPLALQIALTILILDFTAYAWHRANHRVPLLWRFHAVHHSDGVFDASTAVRFHPGELVISLGIRLLVVAAFGVPVIGILIFEIVYAFLNFFEHGDTRLPARLEALWSILFVSPALHRKHHSIHRHELNSNFVTIFSLWDRLFSTFRVSSSSEQVAVGLSGLEKTSGLWALLILPTRKPPGTRD